VVAVVDLQTHQNPLEPVDLVVVELDKSPLKELQEQQTLVAEEERVEVLVHHT
jgi:hypothetical protein